MKGAKNEGNDGRERRGGEEGGKSIRSESNSAMSKQGSRSQELAQIGSYTRSGCSAGSPIKIFAAAFLDSSCVSIVPLAPEFAFRRASVCQLCRLEIKRTRIN